MADQLAEYPLSDLADRVAIITGASMGLGAVMAEALASKGVKVVGVARRAEPLNAFARSINERFGPDAFTPIPGDVSSRSLCESVVEATRSRFARIDILINNAGVGSNHARPEGLEGTLTFWRCDPDSWAHALAINCAGAFYMARYATPLMLERGWGRIINNTTNFHTMLGPGRSGYGPGKAGLEASTLIWSKELAGTGVTANVLIPGGPTATPIHEKSRGIPLDRMLRPEIVAPPALWLSSSASDGVTGMRFSARLWDASLPPVEAARLAGQPAAWDQLSAGVAKVPQYQA